MRKIAQQIVFFFIAFYKQVISPFTPSTCRYQPTCSSYLRDAIKTYGLRKGGIMGVKRILSCHPWGGKGFDPVPPKSDNNLQTIQKS